MPTVVHGPFFRPLSNGHCDASMHARPSLHCLRSVPLHVPLAQSSSFAQGSPLARAAACALHSKIWPNPVVVFQPAAQLSPALQPVVAENGLHVEHTL